jgi:hypothetical protein
VRAVTASSAVAPEYVRYVAAARSQGRLGPERALGDGEVGERVHLDPRSAAQLMRVAALRSAGLFRPTKRTEIAWVDGQDELAVLVGELDLQLADGLVVVVVPVRCDQAHGHVLVTFVVGSPDRPRGLYAATETRPRGPAVVVDTWGESLVAFGWQCLLGLVTGMAGATGKDARGNVMVPVEVAANADGLFVVPMGRHRFGGSTGLLGTRR